MSRLARFAGVYDALIIGGGIVGAGVARDAARRGLRVALVERDDFGGGTTSGSTRLAHGGLRYLQSGDFRLVRLDLREREILLRIAPHLVRPLPFLLPFRPSGRFDALWLRAGMALYDALSYDKSLPSHRVLDREALRREEPGLAPSRVSGAALFYDAQVFSPERLALENLIDARGHGATVLPCVEVTGALHEAGGVKGVRVVDRLDGGETEILARVTINASGPWFDRVAGRLEPAQAARLRLTKGIHVACDPVTAHAIVLRSAVDGRVVFAIPWAGYTWLGTTDTDYAGDPAEAAANEADVRYLIDSTVPFLPALAGARRHWTTAGVRALVAEEGRPSDVSRMHQVRMDVPGLLSVLGGKLTGYRAIAEEVTDALCARLGSRTRSTTREAALPGGGHHGSGSTHLAAIYGSRAVELEALIDREPALRQPLAAEYPDLAAQVVFSVREEWCGRLADFMLRRSYLGFRPDGGRAAAGPASRWMQGELGWSEARREAEVSGYLSLLASRQRAVCPS